MESAQLRPRGEASPNLCRHRAAEAQIYACMHASMHAWARSAVRPTERSLCDAGVCVRVRGQLAGCCRLADVRMLGLTSHRIPANACMLACMETEICTSAALVGALP